MEHYFKIGEIAELFHLNIRTLRYYDGIDLLKPEFIDEKTGYRYYSTTQFEQLNTIRYLRELEVPLEDIKKFLQNREVSSMKKILQTQIQEVERKQHELEIIKKKLQGRIAQIETAQQGNRGHVEIRHIEERNALILKYATRSDSDLEYPIRLLAKNIRTASVFLGKVGLSIEKERLEAGDFANYDYIFLLLDPDEAAENSGSAVNEDHEENGSYTIPDGDYAVMRFRGTHREAESNYRKMKKQIEKQGYAIAGNSLEITLVDRGFTSDEQLFVTEVQIPVKRNAR